MATQQDMWHRNWSISVIVTALVISSTCFAQAEHSEVVSGNIPTHGYHLIPSFRPTRTLRSLSFGIPSTPVHLRILGIKLPLESDTTSTIRYAIVDTNGNAIAGVKFLSTIGHIVFRNEDGPLYQTSPTFFPFDSAWITTQLRLAICIDASACSRRFYPLIRLALDSLHWALGPFDSLSLILASHYPVYLFPMTLQRSIPSLGSFLESTSHSGLSRLYYTVLHTLRMLNPSAAIIITGCDDYASYDILPDDVLLLAHRLNIPLYCIAIGENVDSTPWEILSAYSGGRFYRIHSADDIQYLCDALIEIVRTEQIASRAEAVLPASFVSLLSDGCSVELAIPVSGQLVRDSVLIPPRQAANPLRQIVALFENSSATVDSLYIPFIQALALLLRANPSERIELIGHAYEEGSEHGMRNLSAERVRAIWEKLRSLGVSADQIRLRAVGALKPIYPTALSAEEFALNRRVELRWLHPSLFPYELVVAYTYREDDALETVEQWQQRGYHAYVENVVIAGRPAFRVKLWGFATEQQARLAAASIARKYHTVVTIE
ncbi:MAG: OmpA family protein [Bacteroidota bacterium]|nr:OmpA family protein [Bacteroidota bacterium]